MNPYEHLWKSLKSTIVDLMGAITPADDSVLPPFAPEYKEAFTIVKDIMDKGEEIKFGKKEQAEDKQ
jgi:hypothetical protein